MTRKHFLIGISTAALAAGTASAQVSRDNTDANGNREVEQCTVNNTCNVDNQQAGNDRNFGLVSTGGSNNTLTVTQRGDDNSATVEANGSSNTGRVNQTGDDHVADIDMTGRLNTSFIDQNEEDNVATVIQINTVSATGTSVNISGIAQGTALGTSGTAGATGSNPGENNVAAVSQNGTRLTSTIEQAAAAAIDASADNNSATVTQTGEGSTSTVRQRSSGNIARVNMSQGGANFGVPSADARGNSRNQSTVIQTNTVLVDDASTTATGDFVAGTPSAANNPNSNNNADVAIAGLQNSSTVQQNGVNNLARVSMLGGGIGNTEATADLTNPANVGANGTALPPNRREGNTSDVTQVGQNLTYRASIGGVNPANGRNGRGNSANVTQGSAGTLGSGHTTFMFQRGTLDTATVTQNNNALGAGGAQQGSSVANIAQASFGSTATVTQTGTNEARVSQGLNANGSGGQNGITITQVDQGDMTTGGTTPTDPFGSGGGAPVTTGAQNFANVAQFGTGNTATVAQTATNASATVFQRRDSNDATVTVNQGTGAAGGGFGSGVVTGTAAVNVTALVRQGGTGTVDVRQDGTSLNAEVNQNNVATALVASGAGNANPVALVSQVGRNNSATVNQEGINTSATVDQRFTNAGSLINTVRIDQQGGDANGDNVAVARQGSGAGASSTGVSSGAGAIASGPAGDPEARAAGARSAEIIIFQSNTATGATSGFANSATVEQRGAGQYARISQTGTDNEAGILQEAAATNAVAIIEQTGVGNTFFITQTDPGQFLRVSQNGGTNTVITGTGATSTGQTTPGGVGSGGTSPVFTTTP